MRKNKRIVATVILGAMVISCTPTCTVKAEQVNITAGVTDNLKQYDAQLAELKETDTYEYYKLYKETIMQLPDPMETIYDCFSEEDILVIQKLVEAENEGTDFDSKVNTTNVILNRLYSEEFSDNVYENLTQKHQFSSYGNGRYKKAVPTQSTIDAVEYAFMFEDSTNGSLFFCNEADVESLTVLSWFKEKLEFVMTDSSGHSFYKLKDIEE